MAQEEIQSGHRVLSLGCRSRTLTLLIIQSQPAPEMVGLDLDPKLFASAKSNIANAGCDLLDEGMLFSRPYPDASFDRVLSSLRELDISPRIEAVYQAMNGSITDKARMQSIVMVLFFVLCQVMGLMCVVSDLSLADDAAQLAEGMSDVTCPMDGTIMCPPSAASSPERQLRQTATIHLSQTSVLLGSIAGVTAISILVPWSWSSTLELVPISISSSSVLRI